MPATGATRTRVNLRSGPGTTRAIRRTLDPHTTLDLLDEQGDWLHVKVAGTKAGAEPVMPGVEAPR